ncbi:MAG TPA: hypothetical protein VFB14_13860 [Bryobacteraceae bacterium]|jgi:hypothetical protein|nr:hypothetical protein [Bryobacteraceae bacterium]
MNRVWATEIQKLGGDVSDEVWRWLLFRGPHGPYFTWKQTKSNPPGYVGIEHLENEIAAIEQQDATFRDRLRAVLVAALSSTDPNVLRRAIQVAAVVGGKPELESIVRLTAHEAISVAGEAKAAAFYLDRKLKRSQND